jgi:hypothetical protein
MYRNLDLKFNGDLASLHDHWLAVKSDKYAEKIVWAAGTRTVLACMTACPEPSEQETERKVTSMSPRTRLRVFPKAARCPGHYIRPQMSIQMQTYFGAARKSASHHCHDPQVKLLFFICLRIVITN